MPVTTDEISSLAIVVPAWNAEKTLEKCLISVKRQQCFLVVIDDCSTDKTGEIARKYADYVIRNNERKGKAQSVNEAASFLQFEYTLIVDSDTYLSRDFVTTLRRSLATFKADCGSGIPVFIGTSKYARHVAAIYNKMNNGEDWYYNGCCQFFRTEFLRKNPLDPKCLIEDEELHWRILKNNLKMKAMIINSYAFTEAPHTPKQEYRQRLRWVRGAMQLVQMKMMPRRQGPRPDIAIVTMTATVISVIIGAWHGPLWALAIPLLVPAAIIVLSMGRLRWGFNRYLIPLFCLDDIVFFEALFKKKHNPQEDWK